MRVRLRAGQFFTPNSWANIERIASENVKVFPKITPERTFFTIETQRYREKYTVSMY
jgi:hypothetical protein